MTDPIIDTARELLAFTQENMPPYILVDKALLGNVCRALIERTDALRGSTKRR